MAEQRSIQALWGVGLVAFAVVALASPGRIDIVDGQTRYEVARSLVEHGDTAIRDSRVWFQVFPGRGWRPYASYRLPQSLVGTAAIAIADLTGPDTEARRRFFFALSSACAAGALAACYQSWFRARGLPPRSAALWAGLGIVATPVWFYGTSSFDDVLGATAIAAAVLFAYLGRDRRAWWPHVTAGLALGVAFHCKPPLAAFVLVVLAAGACSAVNAGRRRALVMGLLLLALVAHVAYDRYKFPPENAAQRESLRPLYVDAFPGHPVAGAVSLLVSPGKGVLWYCPAALLGVIGWWIARRSERWLPLAVAIGGSAFLLFFASFTFFSGDPAWGPRYLVPLLALLWFAAPEGYARLGRLASVTLVGCSVLVQLLSLAVDPHRLYVERDLPSAFYHRRPWVYFDPAVSHLLQRPREILEIARDVRIGRRAEAFTPAPEPTFTFPVLDYLEKGPAAVARYQVLAGFRPFWLSYRWLPTEERPVSIGAAAALLGACGLFGAALL